MSLGTVVFTDEVLGSVIGCQLRDGRITLIVDVPQPHPRFDAAVWRVHGDDGELICTVAYNEPCVVRALDSGGTTTVYCPVTITGGDNVADPIRPPKRLPTDGTVTYR